MLIILQVSHFISHLITLAPMAACPGADAVGKQLQTVAQSIQGDARLVGLTVFLIAVIVAGIMRMVAFGSERRVALSNMALTAAVVGLAIIFLAPVISTALSQMAGGANC